MSIRLAVILAVAFSVLGMVAQIFLLQAELDRTKTTLEETRDSLSLSEKQYEQEVIARQAAERFAEAASSRTSGTVQDERDIRNEPVTYNCASSPAVVLALDQLRDRQARRRAAPTDSAEPSDMQ